MSLTTEFFQPCLNTFASITISRILYWTACKHESSYKQRPLYLYAHQCRCLPPRPLVRIHNSDVSTPSNPISFQALSSDTQKENLRSTCVTYNCRRNDIVEMSICIVFIYFLHYTFHYVLRSQYSTVFSLKMHTFIINESRCTQQWHESYRKEPEPFENFGNVP